MSVDLDQLLADLRTTVARDHGHNAVDELDQVFAIAERVHSDERRRSGDPYITHPLIVAQSIANWGLPLSCIKAALAHDIPGAADIRNFEDALGPTVVAHVRAVNELRPDVDAMTLLTPEHAGSQQFMRNVVAIKVADRLHNARTWQYVPLLKAQERARQTLAQVAPAATVLDIPGVAEELRALSTAILAQPLPAPTGSVLANALRLLPPEHRDRYLQEWSADLAQLTTRRERWSMATGLLYSAITIRRQTR